MAMSSEIRDALCSGRLANLTTLNRDGNPQVSAVWVGVEGEDVVIGHLVGGAKTRNFARDPRVALSVEVAGANSIGMANTSSSKAVLTSSRADRPSSCSASLRYAWDRA